MTTDSGSNENFSPSGDYPAILNIEYKPRLSRLTTFFRLFTVIPIIIIAGLAFGFSVYNFRDTATEVGDQIVEGIIAVIFLLTIFSILPGLALATILMLIFRRKYPRWWFDFHLEVLRFATRINAYVDLLTDDYPSTDDHQGVELNIEYPNAQELNPLLAIFKWLFIIPHLIVLFFVGIPYVLSIIVAWFAILILGRYPRPLFRFVVGVNRWWVRVYAYAGIFATDRYPPFSLK